MSLINPNTSHIWGPANGCRAYPHIALGYPSEDTEDKKRGRAAHYIGAQMIKSHTENGVFPILSNDLTDETGYPIDKEIYDSAQIYASDVIETWRVYKKQSPPILETPLSFPSIHPDQEGKPDAWMWIPGVPTTGAWNILHVWEFKNGRREVSPIKHYPMINYSSGILDLMGVNGHEDQRTIVHFRIVQPRCYTGNGPVSEYIVYASDLRGDFNILNKATTEVYSGIAPRRAGKHCIDCPACFECKECLNSINNLCNITGLEGDVFRQPETIDNLCVLLNQYTDLSTRIKNVSKAMKAEIVQRLKKGERSTFKKLKTTYSNLSWEGSYDEITLLGDNLGFNLRDKDLMTPTQAIDAGMDPETVKAFSNRKQTGFTLEDISSEKARRLFYGNRKP